MFMFGLRQRYDSPPTTASMEPLEMLPDTLRPGIAGALAANGSISLHTRWRRSSPWPIAAW